MQYIIPVEDYLISNDAIAMPNSTNPSEYKKYKGPTFLYFNDSIVIFNLGVSGKTDILRIVEKKWDDFHKCPVLFCNNYYKKEITSTPDAYIYIPYLSNDIRDYKSSTPKRPMSEYTHGQISISFNHRFVTFSMNDAVSNTERIPALKKKYPQYFK